MSTLKYLIIVLALTIVFTSCQQPGGDTPGSEFMPDMGHSIAYEANVYTDYSMNVWDNSVKGRKELSIPGLPVKGTIPRGYAGEHTTDAIAQMNGTATTNAISIPANGSVPYYYDDNEEERARAMSEIINNPFPITTAGLETGKVLYDIQCGICHGKKGDGNGWLVDEANANAVYPAAPANFLQDTFYNSTNGRFYHAIMHGKNVMGGYADKLSYEERWQVIHYIHSLMAKGNKTEYSEVMNTLTSNSADRPGITMPIAEHHDGDADQEHSESEGHEGEADHSHDSDNGGGDHH